MLSCLLRGPRVHEAKGGRQRGGGLLALPRPLAAGPSLALAGLAGPLKAEEALPCPGAALAEAEVGWGEARGWAPEARDGAKLGGRPGGQALGRGLPRPAPPDKARAPGNGGGWCVAPVEAAAALGAGGRRGLVAGPGPPLGPLSLRLFVPLAVSPLGLVGHSPPLEG